MERLLHTPFTINRLQFKNRILRSSIGGRMCNYDGTLTDVWKNFEKRFADGGVGGIVSTTFAVNVDRLSPLEYPSIATDRNVGFLKRFLPQIRDRGCKYIVQIGDPGYATQTSLFPDERDALTSSAGFDLNYGYNNRRIAMTDEDIQQTLDDFERAAVRVKEAEADGIEITAAKGYLVHQFLSPTINRRTDKYGGTPDKRFTLLREIVQRVRTVVGDDFPLGVRMAYDDFARSPLLFYLLRFPRANGNDAEQMREYAVQLARLGVDYLHICGGFGFPNPHDIPGRFPTEEIRMHFNATRHLSAKAHWRAVLLNTLPLWLSDWALNIGWAVKPEANLDGAKGIQQRLAKDVPDRKVAIIVNGGFHERSDIEDALCSGMSAVSMARALIANPSLVEDYRRGDKLPNPVCSYCSRCVGRVPTSPLGCYDVRRFSAGGADAQRLMHEQILQWNRADP